MVARAWAGLVPAPGRAAALVWTAGFFDRDGFPDAGSFAFPAARGAALTACLVRLRAGFVPLAARFTAFFDPVTLRAVLFATVHVYQSWTRSCRVYLVHQYFFDTGAKVFPGWLMAEPRRSMRTEVTACAR